MFGWMSMYQHFAKQLKRCLAQQAFLELQLWQDIAVHIERKLQTTHDSVRENTLIM